MKLFDCGVPEPAWSGVLGVIGVCISGALFFLSLYHPPQTQLAAFGHSSKQMGAAFVSEPRIRLALWSVVTWLVTVGGV